MAVKMSKLKKSNKQIKKRTKTKVRRTVSRAQPKSQFGAVSAINTAPVAIGNTITGSEPQTFQTANGVRILGRDFAFTAIGTGSLTTWTLVGGLPLTPCVFPTTVLRNFVQMYSKYKIHRLVVHYITSSATSATGSILFYHAKNRNSPMIDWSNSSFLPYVLSDSHAQFGPQWTNHSMVIAPKGGWKTTDYGLSADLQDQTFGEFFLFSKTSTTDSPGYILIDYDMEFSELNVNPRAGYLPVAQGQWIQVNIGGTAVVVVQATTAFSPVLKGTNIDGSTSVVPPNAQAGDIYKVMIDVTSSVASSWTGASTANLFEFVADPSAGVGFTLDDGFTAYAIWTGTFFDFFSNATQAMAGSNKALYNVSATVTYNLQCWMSLIYSTKNAQSSY